jgi:hypothetical protein
MPRKTVELTAREKERIVSYLMSMCDYLDGRGLIVTDEDLLRQTLQDDFSHFSKLQEIMGSVLDA